MGHSYQELFYHVVWATKLREPYITGDVEKEVYPFLLNRCKKHGATVHAIGGVSDHIHIACSIPPTIALSSFIQDLKGSAAHFVSRLDTKNSNFLAWQPGYGALTFSRSDMDNVVTYVRRQKIHHAEKSTYELYERVE